MRGEAGYIGNQPNFTIINTGVWRLNDFYQRKRQNIWKDGSDPYLNNVVLYLKGDGVNNSTTITDSSLSPKTASIFGQTKISTAQSMYGGSSIFFDGNGDYLTFPAGSDSFNIRIDSYTLECWFNPSTTGSHMLFGNTGDDFYPLQYFNGNWYVGDGITNTIIYSMTLAINTWYHMALSFDGVTYRLFVNGSLVSTSNTLLKNYTLSTFGVGGRVSQGVYTNGYIDSQRITKGIVRYTANFNPETDTYLAY